MTDPRKDYLAAYRRSVATPSGVRDANLQAVLEHAAAIEAEPAPASRWAASVLVLKITTAALLTTGLGWAAVSAFSDENAPAPTPVATSAATLEPPQPSAAKTPSAPPPSLEPVPAAAPTVVTAPIPPSRSRATPPATPQPKTQAADLLREEIALLEAAQSHLDAGRLSQAEASLREHARRFPRGSLAVERTAWQAIVACSGAGSQPKAAARSFLLTHGDSPLGAKVKAKCSL